MMITVFDRNPKFDKYCSLNWMTTILTYIILFVVISVLVFIGLI